MPRGGKREGAGRPEGSVNRATVEQKATISDLAKEFTELALGALVEVAQAGSDAARVAAANALLDRAYGKPPQALTGDPENPLHVEAKVVREIVYPAGKAPA